jgi:CRISPR-associated endonuclease/helicase Cas3
LARWDEQTLRPWAEGEFAWQLSQVQVRQALIRGMVETFDDPGLQAAVQKVLPELPDRGKWSVLLPLYQRENGVWQGQALNKSGEVVTVYYDTQLGLLMEGEIEEHV